MEKILIIDGKEVPFKSTGAFLLRYKSQFRKDALQDLMKLEKCFNVQTGALEDLEALDLEVFFNLIWTMAKTANPHILPPIEWLDTFDEFPLMEIIPELQDMLFSSFKSSISSKKK